MPMKCQDLFIGKSGSSECCILMSFKNIRLTDVFGCSDKMPLNTSLKSEKSQSPTQAQATVADTQAEADVLTTPPDPNVPSGILSVIIHQINNCERIFSYDMFHSLM